MGCERDPLGESLRAGTELGPSRWVEIHKERIDRFASATEDSQWLWFELAGDGGYDVTVNYGVNRVRFPAPVPVGSHVRASFRIEEVEAVDGGDQARIAATVERQGHEKPVCVAELLLRLLT